MNGTVRYRKGPVMLYLNGRWISEGDANVMLQRSSQSILHVGSYWVWNGAASYDVTQNITAQVSISNLFNQDPPKYAITLATNAALGTYDYFGRAFVFKLKSRF